jgi:hypothetical protein
MRGWSARLSLTRCSPPDVEAEADARAMRARHTAADARCIAGRTSEGERRRVLFWRLRRKVGWLYKRVVAMQQQRQQQRRRRLHHACGAQGKRNTGVSLKSFSLFVVVFSNSFVRTPKTSLPVQPNPSLPPPDFRSLANISGGKKNNCIYNCCWAAGEGARHSGAPMLRRYAATSASLKWMANPKCGVPTTTSRQIVSERW